MVIHIHYDKTYTDLNNLILNKIFVNSITSDFKHKLTPYSVKTIGVFFI